MAVFVLTNAAVLAGGVDLTGQSNEVTVQASADEKVVTTFASSGYNEYVGGLRSGSVDVKGNWFAGTGTSPDDFAFPNLGVSGTMVSVSPDGADGSIVYGMESMQSQYATFTKVGEVLPFDAMFLNRGTAKGVARGTILYPATTDTTATGTGTGRQLGAASTSQTLYAWLHVVSVAGTASPTLTALIQSDDNAGFTSPTTRLTFTGMTAVGSQFQTSTAGTGTDDRYRVSYTISGTSPHFKFLVALAIV